MKNLGIRGEDPCGSYTEAKIFRVFFSQTVTPDNLKYL